MSLLKTLHNYSNIALLNFRRSPLLQAGSRLPKNGLSYSTLAPTPSSLGPIPLHLSISKMPDAALTYEDGPLVWVDLEMTGLDPKRDKIMEIAVRICLFILPVVSHDRSNVTERNPLLLFS